MKKILILILVLSTGLVNAEVEKNPLRYVKPRLVEMLQPSSMGMGKNLREIKEVANSRNTEISGAIENYVIAKKNVSIARSNFNPITTGHLLGISLGLNFLWAPLAVDAILSIPTKFYNLSKNKHLASAKEYNLYDVRQIINNEVAHLYYDILTHEVILKTIDLEMEVLRYQELRWLENKYSERRIADQRKYILRLGMERVDIYKLYLSELAAFRTLISTSENSSYELSQVDILINKSLINGIELDRLQNLSLKYSNKYKAARSLTLAAQKNVKQVKWSLITLGGFNFSYKRNVKNAQNEERIASLRQQSVAKEVKTNVLLQVSKLDSNIDIFDNYNYVSNASLDIFEDTLQSYEMGQINEDSVVETAIVAIRDYRTKVVAHYTAWASVDDFSNSANYDFTINPNDEDRSFQKQIETNPLYKLDEDSFSVKIKEDQGLTFYLSSPKIGTVSKVEYEFDEENLDTQFSDDGRSNYAVTFFSKEMPAIISGVANVTLDNGYEFQIKFSFKK